MLHFDKCNTAGRLHRWINFRRYNTARGQTPRDEMPDGEFYARDQKRLLATVEETEEIEEIENSPVALEGCHCIDAHSAHRNAPRNFGENINRYEHITHQCVTLRGQRRHNSEIEKRRAGRKPRRILKIILRYATSSAKLSLDMREDAWHACVCVTPPRSFERKSFLPPCQSRGPQDGNYGTPLHAARQFDRYFHVGEKYVTNPTLTSSGFRSRSLVQRYISYIARGAARRGRVLLHVPHFPTSFHILRYALEANVTRSLKTYTKPTRSC